MERRVLFLHPVGPLNSVLTSHTLFGATCWALAALREDVGALLAGFAQGGPRFAFGNVFPYLRGVKNRSPVLLLPKPRIRIPVADVSRQAGHADASQIRRTVDMAKAIQQKAHYLSAAVSRQLQSGVWKPVDLLTGVLQGDIVLTANALLTRREQSAIWARGPRKLMHSALIQRNSVDRVAGATVEGLLFQEKQTFFRAGRAGLWAAVAADAILWPKLEAAFRYLADTGLGSERTLGKGHFTYQWEPWHTWFPKIDESKMDCFVSLGQYIPAAPTETEPLAYALLPLRQKAENRYPTGERPRVYTAAFQAFDAGGIFRTGVRKALYGRLVELTQLADRTVYYSGLTLPLWGVWEVGT